MHELCLNCFQYSPYVGSGAPIEALIAAAADAGFAHIGLDVYALDASGHAPGDTRGLLERHRVSCFEMLGLDVGVDDDAAVAMAQTAARWVGETGAAWVLTIVSSAPNAEVVDRFGRCADIIRVEGGRLALEFLPFLPVDTIASARSVCESVGAERAKVLIDSWHVGRGSDTPETVAACDAEWIAYVQFDDALPAIGPLTDEVTTRRTWPGEGELELDEFAAAVRASGYTGPVSIELLNREWRTRGMAPEEFAQRAMITSAPYWW
jgi:sugar phosphate isomerase/epimerase